MRFTRDGAILQLDQLIKGELKPAASRALHERLAHLRSGELAVLRAVALEAVDNCMDRWLWLLEGGEGLELVFRDAHGKCINVTELSDGLSVDMHGWIERFSKYPPSIASSG